MSNLNKFIWFLLNRVDSRKTNAWILIIICFILTNFTGCAVMPYSKPFEASITLDRGETFPVTIIGKENENVFVLIPNSDNELYFINKENITAILVQDPDKSKVIPIRNVFFRYRDWAEPRYAGLRFAPISSFIQPVRNQGDEQDRAEQQRLAALQAEQARIERERAELERQNAQRAEQERAEQQRLAALQAEQARIELERQNAQRAEQDRAEQQRLTAIRLEQERAERERQQSIDSNPGLEGVVNRATSRILQNIEPRSRVAIIQISTDAVLNDFIIGELETILINQGFRRIDRGTIDNALVRLNLQLGTLVDERTAISVGRSAGADYIITGRIDGVGELRRLRLFAINTETSDVEAVANEQMP
jgi:hypothetical protein